VNQEGNGVPERVTLADTREKFDAVLFDPHPPASSIAFLAPGKVVVDLFGPYGQTRRDAFKDGREAFPV
jgi:hypothetical protein